MFKTTTSFTFNALKSETPKFGVRHSAQSKKNRISVQLLKDFHGVGVRGQIVQVKPSAMINRLHPRNGAVYLNIPGAKPVIPVVKPEDLKPVEPVITKTEEAPVVEEPQVQTPMLSLEDLISVDVTQLLGTERESIIASIPKKLIFVNESNAKVLKNPIDLSKIKSNLLKYTSKELDGIATQESVSTFFDDSELALTIKNKEGVDISVIESVGAYDVFVNEGERTLSTIRVFVNSKNEK
ncbi:unnamed protein product [Ambrosiozyma monospora]|uniref:Unnamed protein product n=1 Tax=Ambrosiozyma monospora TaxID=43982 RepID=A0A9W6YU89_AMBMO|nr:unnamed protein product [Ambrosiozyma monospora]